MRMDFGYRKDEEIEKSAEGPPPINNRLANDSDITRDHKCSISEEGSANDEKIPSPADFQQEKKRYVSATVNVSRPSSQIIESRDEQRIDIRRFVTIDSPGVILVSFLILWTAFLVLHDISSRLEGVHLSKNSSPRKTTPFPQYDLITEKTLLLTKKFVHADSNATIELIGSKTALVVIGSAVMHSQLEESLRQELGGHLSELKELIVEGIDRSTILSASFPTTLDRLRIAITFTCSDLQQFIERQTQWITVPQTMMDKMTNSFEALVKSTVDHTGHLLIKAKEVDNIFRHIDHKLETFSDLAGRSRMTFLAGFQQLLKGSLWTCLLDRGNIDLVKHQRYLQSLDRLQPMIRDTLLQVGTLINRLTSFKAEVGDLQSTASSLESSSSFSIEEQKHRLKQSLDGLTRLKQSFDKKQEEPDPF